MMCCSWKMQRAQCREDLRGAWIWEVTLLLRHGHDGLEKESERSWLSSFYNPSEGKTVVDDTIF